MRFVILCLGRTGSTYLQSLLDSHPQVSCLGELFTRNSGAPLPAYGAQSERDIRKYLDAVLGAESERAVGFKLAWNNIRHHPVAFESLQDPELRVVRLVRQNRLATLVSIQLSVTTGIKNHNSRDYGDAQVRLRPQNCLRQLEEYEAVDAAFDALARHHPHCTVIYEELVTDSSLTEVQKLLGVEPRTLTSAMQKRRKKSLSESVSNWEELISALAGTRFERYLADAP